MSPFITQQSAYDLQFMFNKNYASIFYRFLRFANFSWCPHWGWPRSNFNKIFGFRKQEFPGYHGHCLFHLTFSHFSTTMTCDSQTHRQTQGHSIYHAKHTSHSKNRLHLPKFSVGLGYDAEGAPSTKWLEHTRLFLLGVQFFLVIWSCRLTWIAKKTTFVHSSVFTFIL